MTVRVQQKDFNLGDELKTLHKGNHAIGGVCAFTGLVRDMSHNGEISTMTLEYYPSMTEKILQKIKAQAQQRWSLEASLIIHRYGKLNAGEQIVLVATASHNRDAAFESCQFIMDFLKTKAPFWKIETDLNGNQQWVEAKNCDNIIASNWTKNN